MKLSALLLTFFLLSACDSGKPVEQWPINQQCDLHQQACQSQQAGQAVTLKIAPNPIPIARPLAVQVDLKGVDAETVELDISGINMYMGFNRIHLTSQNSQHWVGTSMLAFCTNEQMDWQITLMIQQKNGNQLQVPYQLTTRNR